MFQKLKSFDWVSVIIIFLFFCVLSLVSYNTAIVTDQNGNDELLQLFAPRHQKYGASIYSAKATMLVSDLRSAKTACSMWIADNDDLTNEQIKDSWNSSTMVNNLTQYYDNREKVHDLLFIVTGDGHCLVGKSESDARVIERSIALAGSALLNELGDTLTVDNAADGVYMRVR